MAIRELRAFDGTTFGVTIPKGSLRQEGLLSEDGELVEDEVNVEFYRADDGEWRVKRLDADSQPVGSTRDIDSA